MTHALTAHLLGRNLNAALLADLSLEAGAFIFTAKALPVLLRAKDLLAEETALLRLECTVVDGFGLGDLAVRPAADHIGRCKTDLDRIKYFHRI